MTAEERAREWIRWFDSIPYYDEEDWITHWNKENQAYDILRDLLAELEQVKNDLERTRVQLAGCGVAAMQNTEKSRKERAKPGDYGYSASYGDVCRAVDREMKLWDELEQAKQETEDLCTELEQYRSLAVTVGASKAVEDLKRETAREICESLDIQGYPDNEVALIKRRYGI